MAKHEANATVKAQITGMCGPVFEPGVRVYAQPRSELDIENGWVTLEGLPGWPCIVCVPINRIEIDADQ